MRVTGWLQAGIIMLVLGIFVGAYGVGIWALALGQDTDADSGAKIASPIMMLASVPLLVVGLGMTISGIFWERHVFREALVARRQEAEAASSVRSRPE
ncbi:hypothetical protein [Rothia uropygialis]|uniref:hypothetical protein n=1 Tax=Kocuria sp. 36 TaxID=1415402 RepID=UPI00101DD42F|nr:hypothetical protein [Kocuria sp. 36]